MPIFAKKRYSRVRKSGIKAYLNNPQWDMRTVRNTRQGRSLASIQAQVDRALASTVGTNAYYKNYRRLTSIAQRYNQNIQNEIAKRAAENPNSMGNAMLSRYQRDYTRERYAMMGRNVYEGRGGSQSAQGAKGNSVG